MTTEKVKRKLTGILSADVKGYSRLMREVEEKDMLDLSLIKIQPKQNTFGIDAQGRVAGIR